MKRLVIFASGSGSNAENIIKHYQDSENVDVMLVLSNNPRAKVLDRCKKLKTNSLVFNRQSFSDKRIILGLLKNIQPDLIILAGFLWKFPEMILKEFPNKTINLHPALLPKFGGKGMYGHFVHEAVIQAKESKSGITIHYVTENYDEGAIIFQAECEIFDSDTPDTLAEKIHRLEMQYFPKVIDSLINE